MLYGSDFPLPPSAAVRFTASRHELTPTSPAARQAIDRANAEKLFPRPTRVRPAPSFPLAATAALHYCAAAGLTR